ncbi:MAG: hypothetical protein HZB53_01115 [Chloroflexi bacterium]|nr:hypothetical protein [Chloroflexota bacterium]
MATLQVFLFGKFRVECDAQAAAGFDVRKVQELLSYLLLHRAHLHSRESLAGVLYGDQPTPQSKKYLRQTLWQLQSALAPFSAAMLDIEPDWITINPQAEFQLDVALFEEAYTRAKDTRGADLDHGNLRDLQVAVELYRDDLLLGWYQDWALRQRERMEHMYLSMVDKLMSYCEAQGLYESGLSYGELMLCRDRAHERTHRRMMRLYYLCGDRTAALRQYDRCVSALREELSVPPADRTRKVYARIVAATTSTDPAPGNPQRARPLTHLLTQLQHTQTILRSIQDQIQVEIQSVERALKHNT